jgi:hypothetical protein
MKLDLFAVCLLAALPLLAAAQEHHKQPKPADQRETTPAPESPASAPRPLDSAPLEIVREKAPGEKANFQLCSGDEVVFVVLRRGLPVQNARVRLITQQGWAKDTLTDAHGRARFQLIRDYFPPWGEFNKWARHTFLVVAETAAPDAGNIQDSSDTNGPNRATLSDSYYPSPKDYSSYAWGLGIVLLVAAFGGTSVYLYRRRRVKPFKEVAFHEGQ